MIDKTYTGHRYNDLVVRNTFERGTLTKIAGQAFALLSVASLAAPLICLVPQVGIPLTAAYVLAGAGGGIGFGLAGSWLNHKYREAVERRPHADESTSYAFSDDRKGESYNSNQVYSSGNNSYSGGRSDFWDGYLIASLLNNNSSRGSSDSGSSSRGSSSDDAGKAIVAVLAVVAVAAAFYCSGKSVYDNFIKPGPALLPPPARALS